MYKLSVFDKDDYYSARLVANINNPLEDITLAEGTIAIHDVDDDWLVIPASGFEHISIVKVIDE